MKYDPTSTALCAYMVTDRTRRAFRKDLSTDRANWDIA